jgi:arsenate reductase (thioredoxin)
MLNVLFLCTGNSARSIMAEGILNAPAMSRGRLRGFSAGSRPRGQVQPMALEALRKQGVSSDGLRSKSWDEFSGPQAPPMDFVITLCDDAARETCPVWPGHPVTAHWSIPDPVASEGDVDTRQRAFDDAAWRLRRRIELLSLLPLEGLERLAREAQVRQIGVDDSVTAPMTRT